MQSTLKHMKFKYVLVLAVFSAVGIYLILFRMVRNDIQALEDFYAYYGIYDRAISDFSTAVRTPNYQGSPVITGDESAASEALSEMNTKASARISSLIKNDEDLMRIMRETAKLAGEEYDALKAYQSAAANHNADLEKLGQAFDDLTKQRQTAYANFQELGGQSVTAGR
jgi:hypothetical protein